MTHSTSVIRAAVVCLALCVLAAPVRAQDDNGEIRGFAKEGGYVGFSFLPRFTFDGKTFDGESIYKEIDGEEVMILPRLSEKDMFRIALGFRGRQAAIEVSYDRSKHAGTFLEGTGEAVFQAINIDGKYFFLTGHRIQPHIVFGGTIPWFTVKDGSFLEPAVGDARFKGYGLNTEAGLTIYPHRQFGISVGYNYRVLYFGDVTGVSETEFRLRPRFNETSGTVVATAHVIF